MRPGRHGDSRDRVGCEGSWRIFSKAVAEAAVFPRRGSAPSGRELVRAARDRSTAAGVGVRPPAPRTNPSSQPAVPRSRRRRRRRRTSVVALSSSARSYGRSRGPRRVPHVAHVGQSPARSSACGRPTARCPLRRSWNCGSARPQGRGCERLQGPRQASRASPGDRGVQTTAVRLGVSRAPIDRGRRCGAGAVSPHPVEQPGASRSARAGFPPRRGAARKPIGGPRSG
jgi:hypothetical protein